MNKKQTEHSARIHFSRAKPETERAVCQISAYPAIGPVTAMSWVPETKKRNKKMKFILASILALGLVSAPALAQTSNTMAPSGSKSSKMMTNPGEKGESGATEATERHQARHHEAMERHHARHDEAMERHHWLHHARSERRETAAQEAKERHHARHHRHRTAMTKTTTDMTERK